MRGKWRGQSQRTHDFSSKPYAIDSIEFFYRPITKNPVLLKQKYVEEGLSIKQIAEQFFSSRAGINYALTRHGVPLRLPHKPHGRPSQPRYGQRLVKGTAQPHLGEKRVIQTVLDLKTQGLSLRQIARFLSQLGVPTKCRGRAWHPQMIARILEANVPTPTRFQKNMEESPLNQEPMPLGVTAPS